MTDTLPPALARLAAVPWPIALVLIEHARGGRLRRGERRILWRRWRVSRAAKADVAAGRGDRRSEFRKAAGASGNGELAREAAGQGWTCHGTEVGMFKGEAAP